MNKNRNHLVRELAEAREQVSLVPRIYYRTTKYAKPMVLEVAGRTCGCAWNGICEECEIGWGFFEGDKPRPRDVVLAEAHSNEAAMERARLALAALETYDAAHLTDVYVARVMGFSARECPPELVQAKRAQLKLLRLTKEGKHADRINDASGKARITSNAHRSSAQSGRRVSRASGR